MTKISSNTCQFCSKETLGITYKDTSRCSRDPDKLREILKVKQRDYEKAEHNEDLERLIPLIEMLKFVLFVVCSSI
jgi:hypothetical protein